MLGAIDPGVQAAMIASGAAVTVALLGHLSGRASRKAIGKPNGVTLMDASSKAVKLAMSLKDDMTHVKSSLYDVGEEQHRVKDELRTAGRATAREYSALVEKVSALAERVEDQAEAFRVHVEISEPLIQIGLKALGATLDEPEPVPGT